MLLESVARHQDEEITAVYLDYLVNWNAEQPTGVVPFKPERVILQDFTGVPAVVDLAAMRDAIVALGGNADTINPEIPVTLVVDHSVQVDCAGTPEAVAFNTAREFERNQERYQFLKWAQGSFDNFEVVPPETGIIHQVNIESLSDVILEKKSLASRFFSGYIARNRFPYNDDQWSRCIGLGRWRYRGRSSDFGRAVIFPDSRSYRCLFCERNACRYDRN